jgi:hypothetical protein
VAGVDSVLTKDGIISPGLGDTVSCPFWEAIIAITNDFFTGRSPFQHNTTMKRNKKF